MKGWIFCMAVFLMGSPIYGQPVNDYRQIDKKAFHFPNEVTYSTQAIATYITSNFKDDTERIRAAYRWVTANIKYDKDSMLAINWNKSNSEKIEATLRRKKGVCDNYASVFSDILLKMRIASYAVNGLTKNNGHINTIAHSWSAVQYEGSWLFCDPTWDEDYRLESHFYLMPADIFLETHWPFDPLWQIVTEPITLKVFEKGFTAINSKKDNYSINDSIKAFLSLDSLQQLEATSKRMKEIGIEEENLKIWYAYNNMNIAIIYEEQNMNLYNAAVADLNKATNYLNQFIEYRNHSFKPTKTDWEINKILLPVDSLINAAYKKIDAIGLVKENLQYNTDSLKERLRTTEKKLREQNSFLSRYINTKTAERPLLFYEK